MVSNFLALTPLDNTWEEDWAVFLKKRFDAQIDALTKVRFECSNGAHLSFNTLQPVPMQHMWFKSRPNPDIIRDNSSVGEGRGHGVQALRRPDRRSDQGRSFLK